MFKKKSLGQHFLRTKSYLSAVANAASIQENEAMLEIGPGDGALTQELLAQGARVSAVEKDSRLIPVLQEKFSGKHFELYEADALEFSLPAELIKNPWKLVGNIPYYITGALIKKFLSGHEQPSLIVFLVQKEVAERIARSKKESILSLSVKAYGTPRYIKTVPRGAFSPPPNVDSAILLIENISRSRFKNTTHEEKFFELLHAGFGHKRKLLKRNLETVLGKKAAEIIQKAGIGESARAEDVPLGHWLLLADN